jgi:HD-like signal output (HDOD) protein
MPAAPSVSVPNPALPRIRGVLAAGFNSGQVSLPVLPLVAGRVMALSNDPNADVADLSDLIHQDQALASNVLRIANSAAYCAGEPIVSLRQAVMRLGMAVLSGIAVAACLQGNTFRTPGHDGYRRRLLVHAFVAAGFAKELARLKRRNVEALFLCGLLHSIGHPVVLHVIATALPGGTLASLSEADVAALGREFHRAAAAAVTVAWKLPQQVQIAAVHQEDPASAPSFIDETRMTALAAQLATWVVQPSGPLDEKAVRDLPAWEQLNYYPDDVDAVLDRREALAASAATFMG